MATAFSDNLSLLRQQRDLSQREAAQDLGISQALLSLYENGQREPGLTFVVKVCDYYGVTADFLLGRTAEKSGDRKLRELAGRLRELSQMADGLLEDGSQ